MSLNDAMTTIQRRRPEAQPIPAFFELLKRYEQQLQQSSRKQKHSGNNEFSMGKKKQKVVAGPSTGPSIGPSIGPSAGPSKKPSLGPSVGPSIGPSVGPHIDPSHGPSARIGPSKDPSIDPSVGLSRAPAVNIDHGKLKESKTNKPAIGPASSPAS